MEDKLNDERHSVTNEETVLFSRSTIYIGEISVLKIHKGLYPHCPEFKALYKYLADLDSDDLAIDKNIKHQKKSAKKKLKFSEQISHLDESGMDTSNLTISYALPTRTRIHVRWE
eukprot:SAG31_NODE_3934_length_3737_cov_14.336998_1_plen_115_part_00